MEGSIRREGMLLLIGIASFLAMVSIGYLVDSSILGFAFGAAFGSVILLLLLYLPHVSLGVVAADIDTVRSQLVFRIRLLQHHVSATPEKLTVGIDSTSSAELRLRSTFQGTKVSYRAAPTQAGWGILIIPIWLTFASFATVISAPIIYYKSARFVRRRIAPLMTELGAMRGMPRADDISSLLMLSAAENHRLFSEAYKAERDRYWDHLGIIGMAALVAWFVLFLIFNLVSPEQDYVRRATDASLPSTVGTLSFAIPLMWIVRRIYKPRLRKWKRWIERIGEVWRIEATRSMPAESAPSSFEILSEAAKEAPQWLKLRRKTALSRDWGAWTLLFLMTLWGIQMAAQGVYALIWNVMMGPVTSTPAWGLTLTLGGIAILAGAWVYYKHWKRKTEEETNRELADWNRRHNELRSRMEQFLKEL